MHIRVRAFFSFIYLLQVINRSYLYYNNMEIRCHFDVDINDIYIPCRYLNLKGDERNVIRKVNMKRVMLLQLLVYPLPRFLNLVETVSLYRYII